uniref:Cholesteryl ester transfer protein, plasma n=1 Tax=Astyanax mexicanus TaxID=7994 RepID=A0A8B9KG28_ASTMX
MAGAFSLGLGLLLLFSFVGKVHSCLDPASAYKFTGAVCRLTYPAAVVLNEKTTEVIKAAFQHAKYPSIEGERSIPFAGKLEYRLHNLEIHNLSIGKSEFELRENEGIGIDIGNVSAVFKGTLKYSYESALMGQSIDFEIESMIDLVINSKLYCGKGKVAADTSDCYLTFHKLQLLLQDDREPGWLKKLFTNLITFTMKLVVKGQICKEINKVANILADFIQDTAEQFLSDGDIFVDIGVTSAPVITSNYVESYHKGLVTYNGSTSIINASRFNPDQLTEDRSLYFWIGDDLMDPLMTAAYNDGRFICNISGEELISLSHDMWNVSVKLILFMPDQLSLFLSFKMENSLTIFLQEAVEKIGIPKVISYLEPELTALMDQQGLHLFDLINPEVIPRDGYVLIQMDFGFPQHLLVEFLKKTLD